MRSKFKQALAAGSVALVFALALNACTQKATEPAPSPTATTVKPTPKPSATPEPTSTPVPDVQSAEPDGPDVVMPPMPDYSIDDPNSIWVVVNKLRPLNPTNYAPSDLYYPEGVSNPNGQPLRLAAATATEELVWHAANEGVYFGYISAYRPYDMQVYLYNSYVARDGQAAADTYSARPGHSEHQTGLTVDFDDFGGCGLSWCFESTAAGVWLSQNAADHGFIMRYPSGSEHITGYMYEPWHYRYVGPELALAMRDAGVLTLEEWFGLPAALDYY